jgi:uncharacterized protein YoaH (UPF0181 family)
MTADLPSVVHADAFIAVMHIQELHPSAVPKKPPELR